MRKKWCCMCSVWFSHPALGACDGPCPEEAHIEIDD